MNPIAINPPKPIFSLSFSLVEGLKLYHNDAGPHHGAYPELEAIPTVKVSHTYNGESWYRFQHCVTINGEEYPIVSQDEWTNWLEMVRNNDNADQVDRLNEQYLKDNIVIGYHAEYGWEIVQVWQNMCQDMEDKFLAIVGLGIIGFPIL